MILTPFLIKIISKKFRNNHGVHFAYPCIQETCWSLEDATPEFVKRLTLKLQAAFASLPQTLTSVDMSGVHGGAEKVFSHVRQNSHVTRLVLSQEAILRGSADESMRSVQSIGSKLLGLRRLEIRSCYRNELPAKLITYILQGFPGLEELSLVNLNVNRGVGIPFTHEPNAPLEENRHSSSYVGQSLLQTI